MNGSTPSSMTPSSAICDPARAFAEADRPQIALITNHGYPSVDFPIGGAPDTGGQIVYVNALAGALDTLGYKVTIFARGGFPYFQSDRIRGETEYLTRHSRYVFVPGGGTSFIRKEDIAIALDEEVTWVSEFIGAEATAAGCRPWDIYQIINTHYWDAAVIGMRLVERWRDDIAAHTLSEILDGVVSREVLEEFGKERHRHAVGTAPEVHLGRLLLENRGALRQALPDSLERAALVMEGRHGLSPATLRHRVIDPARRALDESGKECAPPLRPLIAAEALGKGLFALLGDISGRLHREMARADRHVWTPHSLGSIKEENFKDRDEDVVRTLKFCERRDHERTVCEHSRMFVATSTEIAAQLRTHYAVPARRIFYFPPCVDRNLFRHYTADELAPTYEYLAKISGVDVDDLRASRIVFETSRMDQTKRKDVILAAFARAARENSYLFIGGGPNNDLFERLQAQRDGQSFLRERAFLTGFIPDEHIGPLFAIATVYVSASEMEGFGMSASQAAASGCALVSSDLTPFAVQYVPDAALLVEAGDVVGFAGAIAHLLDDQTDRRRRASQLVERVGELDWEKQAARFLDSLRRCGFTIENGRV